MGYLELWSVHGGCGGRHYCLLKFLNFGTQEFSTVESAADAWMFKGRCGCRHRHRNTVQVHVGAVHVCMWQEIVHEFECWQVIFCEKNFAQVATVFKLEDGGLQRSSHHAFSHSSFTQCHHFWVKFVRKCLFSWSQFWFLAQGHASFVSSVSQCAHSGLHKNNNLKHSFVCFLMWNNKSCHMLLPNDTLSGAHVVDLSKWGSSSGPQSDLPKLVTQSVVTLSWLFWVI